MLDIKFKTKLNSYKINCHSALISKYKFDEVVLQIFKSLIISTIFNIIKILMK